MVTTTPCDARPDVGLDVRVALVVLLVWGLGTSVSDGA